MKSLFIFSLETEKLFGQRLLKKIDNSLEMCMQAVQRCHFAAESLNLQRTLCILAYKLAPLLRLLGFAFLNIIFERRAHRVFFNVVLTLLQFFFTFTYLAV